MISKPGMEKMVKKASEALSLRTLLSKKSFTACLVTFQMFLIDMILNHGLHGLD
jgi:hypothetical protein